MKITRTLVVTFLALALTPLPGEAQGSPCGSVGPYFIGEPTERIIIGPEQLEEEALSEAERAEFQAYVSCTEEGLSYPSRENHPIYDITSGCFRILIDPVSGSVIHAFDTSQPACVDIYGPREFDYSEVIRNGIYQIIYRGKIRHIRPAVSP